MNTQTHERYFFDCRTVSEIKSRYRELMMTYHPDRHTTDKEHYTRITQDINAQYHAALKGADGQTSQGDDGREHTYNYDEATEQAIMDKIAELLALKMEGVEIWLIGLWVWIIGDTKPHKDQLGRNGAGCTWHRKRKCWYWKPYEQRHFYSRASLGALAEQYGAKRFKDDDTSSNGSRKGQGKRQRTQRRELAA